MSSQSGSVLNNGNGRKQLIIKQKQKHNTNARYNGHFNLLTALNLLAPSAGLLLLITNFHIALALNSILDLNGTFPYLIKNKTTNEIIEPRDYMDFDNIYSPNETYKWEQTSQGRNYHLIKAFDFANYFQTDYWHYTSKEDLLLSAYPVANKDLCSKHLDWLEAQLNATLDNNKNNNNNNKLFLNGQEHINLMTMIDSFGRLEAGTFSGHLYWFGSHYECVKASININRYQLEESCSSPAYRRMNNRTCHSSDNYNHHAHNNMIDSSMKKTSDNSGESILKTRYCIGKARDIDWPNEDQDNYTPKISYKVGLCLPEACETLSFSRHKHQFERLMRFNMPEYIKNRLYLDDLYCLPDSRSPIRSFSFSAKIFLTLNGLWLVSILISTVVYSCQKRHQRDLKSIVLDTSEQQEQQETTTLSKSLMTTTTANNNNKQEQTLVDCKYTELNSPANNNNNNLHSHLDNHNHQNHHNGLIIKNNNKLDMSISNDSDKDNDDISTRSYKSSSSSSTLSLWLSESPIIIKIIECLSFKENMKEFQEPPLLLRQPSSSRKLRINLNALDSIKCLCCLLVIFGHIVFIHMQHLNNYTHAIELSNDVYPKLLVAFFNFVDTFFIISGMLTAYFVFKRFNIKKLSNPIIWFHISLLRLLRLSPIYILTFWFIKTVAVYLYDGPLWDYGTDKNSIKGLCMNDHWWKSILYLGNVGTMQPLCILPAWSIIVDSQYSLIVPPILFLILKSKRFAYALILVGSLVSTIKMSHQLANQTAVKTSDMAKIRLHVYPAISRFSAEFYNTAWNRIGPVVIGIFGGHMLYLYDIGKIKHWPWFMRNLSFKIILLIHLLIFILPTMASIETNNGNNNFKPASSNNNNNLNDNNNGGSSSELTIFILSNAALKPLWSMINTIFLLRLITDLRFTSVLARLASHNIWHSLGKLCFVSYLIHYEIILTLLKSRQDGLFEPSWPNAIREFSMVFLISTTLAYIIHILYEAPINKLINLIIGKQEYGNREKNNKTYKTTTTIPTTILCDVTNTSIETNNMSNTMNENNNENNNNNNTNVRLIQNNIINMNGSVKYA